MQLCIVLDSSPPNNPKAFPFTSKKEPSCRVSQKKTPNTPKPTGFMVETGDRFIKL